VGKRTVNSPKKNNQRPAIGIKIRGKEAQHTKITQRAVQKEGGIVEIWGLAAGNEALKRR